MHESESEVAQSCPTLSDPMDCSLPGSAIHGIFQARILEWGGIAFSNAWPLDTEKDKERNSFLRVSGRNPLCWPFGFALEMDWGFGAP